MQVNLINLWCQNQESTHFFKTLLEYKNETYADSSKAW